MARRWRDLFGATIALLPWKPHDLTKLGVGQSINRMTQIGWRLMRVDAGHPHGRMTEQVSNVPFVNAIGSKTRGEGVTGIVESEIHEPRILASVPPACLNRIDVHTRAGIAEHKLLWSSVLL